MKTSYAKLMFTGFACCLLAAADNGQTINTYAGNGTAGFGGDGGQATAANLHFPYGVTADGAGNIYISDQSNQRIRKVAANGTITTIAGTGTVGYTGDGGRPQRVVLLFRRAYRPMEPVMFTSPIRLTMLSAK